MTTEHFVREDGVAIPAVGADALHHALEILWKDHYLEPIQCIEAAGFSHAMVVRFALGLSAQGGAICAIVKNSFAGAVALSCLRHLTNAGSEGVILVLGNPESVPKDGLISPHLLTCGSLGIPIEYLFEGSQFGGIQEVVKSSHNVLFGISNFIPGEVSPFQDELVELLNEQSTPVHVVIAPPGVPITVGPPKEAPLFASSTLSLGAPIKALLKNHDLIGRHYLADISISPKIYQSLSTDFPYLFHEQPVCQIYPKYLGEEEASEKG